MYESLDQLPAAGISSGVLQYEYLDQRAQTGTMYYRIRQVDMDGQVEFSPTVQVDVSASEVIRISPNPVSSILTLQAGSEIQDVTVMNIQGQEMNVQPVIQGQEVEIDLSSLPSALYLIKLTTEGSLSMKRVRKVN